MGRSRVEEELTTDLDDVEGLIVEELLFAETGGVGVFGVLVCDALKVVLDEGLEDDRAEGEFDVSGSDIDSGGDSLMEGPIYRPAVMERVPWWVGHGMTALRVGWPK